MGYSEVGAWHLPRWNDTNFPCKAPQHALPVPMFTGQYSSHSKTRYLDLRHARPTRLPASAPRPHRARRATVMGPASANLHTSGLMRRSIKARQSRSLMRFIPRCAARQMAAAKRDLEKYCHPTTHSSHGGQRKPGLHYSTYPWGPCAPGNSSWQSASASPNPRAPCEATWRG